MRRVEIILLREDDVLIVKIDKDPLMPRASWVFPFADLAEGESPRKIAVRILENMKVNYNIVNTYEYDHPENPKIKYYSYIATTNTLNDPVIGKPFVAHKWILKEDIINYFTSFIDNKLMELIKNTKTNENIEFYP